MDRDARLRWVLPVDLWTGKPPRVQGQTLPKTIEDALQLSAAQWLTLAGPLRLEIRATDSLQTMRGQYGYWVGVGYHLW
jgi:hypothetical protein